MNTASVSRSNRGVGLARMAAGHSAGVTLKITLSRYF